MAILGVESVVYGVDDLETCTRFWVDFGLNPVSADDTESVFDVPSGSRVIVRRNGDPRVPNAFPGNGVKETFYGVDTAENLEQLVAGIAANLPVTRDADGAPHTLECEGLLARCVQHEHDHCQGVLFIDRLSEEQKKAHKDALRQIQRGEMDVSYPVAAAGKTTA